MQTALIIVGMLAAFYSGFYIGYLKREGKPPEIPFVLPILPTKEKEAELSKEEQRANTFYN